MILHNIYVKNVSLSPGKDWAVDGAAAPTHQHQRRQLCKLCQLALWVLGHFAELCRRDVCWDVL